MWWFFLLSASLYSLPTLVAGALLCWLHGDEAELPCLIAQMWSDISSARPGPSSSLWRRASSALDLLLAPRHFNVQSSENVMLGSSDQRERKGGYAGLTYHWPQISLNVSTPSLTFRLGWHNTNLKLVSMEGRKQRLNPSLTSDQYAWLEGDTGLNYLWS